MLPVQDVIPSRTTPWVTVTLAAAIVGLAGIGRLLPGQAWRDLILSYGLVPAHVSWLALVTSTFLHHGLVDAAANAGALWIFGDNVEDRLGRVRFLALFLAGAALGGLVAARLEAEALRPLIGAAGGVGAVAGAHLILLRQARVLMVVPARPLIDLVEVPSALVVLAWVVVVGLTTGPIVGPPSGLPLPVVTPAVGLVVGGLLGRLLARPERLACGWWNVARTQLPERRRTSRETSASSVSNASN